MDRHEAEQTRVPAVVQMEFRSVTVAKCGDLWYLERQ